jgi:hypothetical protein
MEQARGKRIEPLAMLAESGSLSDDALRFLQKRAETYVDDLNLGVEDIIDDTLDAEDWAKDMHGTQSDLYQSIDDEMYVRPKDLVPQEDLYPHAPAWDIMKDIERQHLRLGGDAASGHRTMLAHAAGRQVREMIGSKGGKFGKWVEQMFTQNNINPRIYFTGANAAANVNQVVTRLWASAGDNATLELWMRQINNFWEKQGVLDVRRATLQTQKEALTAQLNGLKTLDGGVQQTLFPGVGVDDAMPPGTQQLDEATRMSVRELEEQIHRIDVLQRELTGEMSNYSELVDILDGMFDDYNRKHIATNPHFKDLVDPDTGLVDPIHLGANAGDTQFQMLRKKAQQDNISLREAAQEMDFQLPDSVLEAFDEWEHLTGKSGEEMARFMDEVLHTKDSPTSYAMQVDTLTLMAAGAHEITPDFILRMSGQKKLVQLREGLHTAHTMWMMDKVLRPATAVVVSLDELMRTWHTGGMGSMFQYVEDKVMGVANAVHAVKQAPSFSKLGRRWQDRINALEQYPLFFKNMERTMVQGYGYGTRTLKFNRKNRLGNREYYDAAERMAGQNLNDAGFQAYMEGPEAFREWFETSTDAAALRDLDYSMPGGMTRRGIPMWEDVYQGYDTMFNHYMLSNIKESKKGAARAWYREAAADAKALGSTQAGTTGVPQWVLEGFGEVTGNAKIPKNKIMGMADTLANPLFNDPVDYRRGFLAEWTRKSERARLTKLYESQGIRVVNEAELKRVLKRRYPEMPDIGIDSKMGQITDELFYSENIITDRFVNELVESKVVQEMDNQLYANWRGSRAGQKTRALAPFGKPWADMWGFWGREMFRRPELRGWINDTNFMNLGDIANKALDYAPINPKTGAFVSRIAATDFDLDRIQEDPLVGSAFEALGISSLDVGKALFLPHGGESPFMVMLPGLGIVPGLLAERIIYATAPDPTEDAIAYQQHIDKFSEILPGIGYNQPQGLPAILGEAAMGGGVVTQTAQLTNSFGMLNQNELIGYGRDQITGDWKVGVAYNRQIKNYLADPEVFAELLELSPDNSDIGLQALVNDMLKDVQSEVAATVGMQSVVERGTELLIPARVQTLNQVDDNEDLWIDMAMGVDGAEGLWPELATPEFWAQFNLNSPEGRADAANSVRDHFFDMDSNDRDIMVAANPGLAVNMVSMWTWSESARDNQVEGSSLPYRSGGSAGDLAQHQSYIEMGFIRPTTPKELVERIVGTVYDSKQRASRFLYEQSVEQVNAQRWYNDVGPKADEWFTSLAAHGHEQGLWPWETGEEVWRNWPAVRDMIWEDQGRPMKNSRKDGTGDEIPDKLSIPADKTFWSVSLPSNPDELRDAFETEDGWPVPRITPQMQAAADALEIDITEGMPMQGVYNAVVDYRTNNFIQNPVFAAIGPAVTAWKRPRSAEHESAMAQFNTAIDGTDVLPEVRFAYRQTVLFLEDAIDARMANDPDWVEKRDYAVGRYKALMVEDVMNSLPLDLWYDQAWGRSLGSLDWTPQEPAPLMEGENFAPGAERVYPKKVVDGDTIHFSSDLNERVFQGPGISLGPRIEPKVYSVRLLGVNAPELGTEEGWEWKRELEAAMDSAIAAGKEVYIVRDPSFSGAEVDMYGRLLGWLYIDGVPWTKPESMIPRRNS